MIIGSHTKNWQRLVANWDFTLRLGVGLGLYDKYDNYSILEEGSFRVFLAAGVVGGCSSGQH